MEYDTIIKNEDGFTIQEILVVIIVGSILIGLSLSLLLFTNKLFRTWSGTSELKSGANRILHQIAIDVQQSREVLEHTDTSLVISKGVGRVVRYSYNGHILSRNEVDLTLPKTIAVKIKVEENNKHVEQKEIATFFHIKVFVQSVLLDYTTEIDVAPTPSSRSLFIKSQQYK